MKCPNCGASILDGASFCESCGLQVGIPPFRSFQLQPPPKKDNKVLWIVAIVVILVIVLPVVLAAVLYVMVLGFGGTSTQTPTSSLTKSIVAGGDKFTFAPMSKDTQWGDVTVLLSDGYNTAAWSPLTADLVGGTIVEWVGGSQMVSAFSVFVNITDLAGNGYINQGDFITMTVGGAGFSSATTYIVTILHDPSGAEICHSYFQGEAEIAPVSSLTTSTIAHGIEITFAPMSRLTVWGDVTILLTDGYSTVSWSPLTIDLDNGTTSRWNHVVATPNLGTLKVNMSIVDLAGNGYINQGDHFDLTLGTGQMFSSTTNYTVTIMHDPTYAEICHIGFRGESEIAPVSSLTRTTITNGTKLTFLPMSTDTPWGNLTILLTDGSNTASWSPLTTDLDNGTTARWNDIAVAANLGTLKVNMSIVDLAGNGYVNQGDFFALTLGYGQMFSAATTYTVTVMYEPLAAEICHIDFQG